MIQLAEVAAAAAVLGAVVAISARDSRLVSLGLFLAMFAAPLASSPEPKALTIVLRILGALLAAYLLAASARSQSIAGDGSGIGALAELAVAGAAFCAGWFVVPVKPLVGPVAAQAGGIALIVLAVAPMTARNVLRAGTGVALLALGIAMLLQAWVGPASPLEEIVLTALLVGIVGATSLLISPIEPISSKRPAAVKVAVAVEAGEDTTVAVLEPSLTSPVTTRRNTPRPAASASPAVSSRPAESMTPGNPAVPAPPTPTTSPTTGIEPPAGGLSPRARRLRPREPRR